MITLKKGTWVLAADGEKALFLRNEGTAAEPHLRVLKVTHNEIEPLVEEVVVRDDPGRFPDPAGERSATEPTDWRWVADQHFAKELAELLYKLAHHGLYDDLIIVAPPKVLHALDEHLHKEVRARLQAEIAHDLVNEPLPRLTEALRREIDKLNA